MEFRRHLSANVIEARAGLIPASDDIEDEKLARMRRTERVAQAISDYAKLNICGSERAAIVNILSDIRHYCNSEGMKFGELYKEASTLYQEEIEAERSL